MLFSHARQGPNVCSAISQLGVNACLVMSPQTVEEQLRHLCLTPLKPELFPNGDFFMGSYQEVSKEGFRNLLFFTKSNRGI